MASINLTSSSSESHLDPDPQVTTIQVHNNGPSAAYSVQIRAIVPMSSHGGGGNVFYGDFEQLQPGREEVAVWENAELHPNFHILQLSWTDNQGIRKRRFYEFDGYSFRQVPSKDPRCKNWEADFKAG